MENEHKEKAVYDWMIMIKKSWTWARLTQKEQERFEKEIKDFSRWTLKGTYKQRWSVLNGVYSVFLGALDYKPLGWRDPEKKEEGLF